MLDFMKITADALDILNYDGAVQDTLEELRRKWGAQVPALLDERFDAVGVQYMRLPHEKGAAALGQELSAFGWALYNLDDEDEYLFTLIPEEERSDWEHYCKKQGQYCRLMKQPGRKWGDHAKEQDPGALMPCEEYILEDEYDYFFNSLSGDFAAGEWKSSHSEEWNYGCVADLRCRPPKVTRSKSLYHFGCISYSDKTGVYAASGASASGLIGKVLLCKNPNTLNFFEPSPIGYDGPPRTLCWAGHSLWVGDPTNATRIELTDRGTCQDVKNWTLPEDGWSSKYHCGITADGLGRVYFSNEWYKGRIYRRADGQVTEHPFPLYGYDHLSEAVPVPGTGRIYMIHSVSGKGRIEECLLELDMDTGRCRITALPGMGEGLKLRWFTEDWLLVQGNGELLSDDFAQLINMTTREVLRIRPGMFGGEKMQHIGVLTDGAVVIVTRRGGVGPVFRYPTDFWGFLRTAGKPRKLEPWREYPEHPFPLYGYDHLSEAVPVPGTGRIYMIHSVSGKGRIEECLLELDMDTGRCRITALPGMGEGLKLRWFTEDWLLVQGNGELLSDDFAQLINMTTREVLRIRPGMFGGEKMQHIGVLTDGAVVIVTRRGGVGPVFRYPTDFWGFLRTAGKPRKLEPWREYQETYPNLPFFLPGEEPKQNGANSSHDTGSPLLRLQFGQLSPEKKQSLMEQLAAQYRLDFVRMEHFDRWGQSCTTGMFKKDGREFVFVPGDTVTLGWEQFAVGLNRESREELEYLFQEWELEQDPAEFIGESMAPVRQVSISPMLVGRELEEINWEPVKLEDPRLRPEWLEDFRQFASTGRDSLTLAGRARFERDSDSWQASLYHEVDYPDFQSWLPASSGIATAGRQASITRWTIRTFKAGCKNRAFPFLHRMNGPTCAVVGAAPCFLGGMG